MRYKAAREATGDETAGAGQGKPQGNDSGETGENGLPLKSG